MELRCSRQGTSQSLWDPLAPERTGPRREVRLTLKSFSLAKWRIMCLRSLVVLVASKTCPEKRTWLALTSVYCTSRGRVCHFLGPQEKLHPPRPPPQPPSCAQGPKGRARWEQSLKQHAGEGHGGTLAPGAAAPRSGGPCPSVCPTHRRPLGSSGYLHPLLSSQLRPDTCPRRQHPPTALSIRSALQGTLPRQRGDETYSQDLLQSGPPPLSGNF